MYEFDTVSVSAFEASELAATLTEKSAEGWDVAAVVTAGSDVVAYLRRATGGESAKQDETAAERAPDEAQPVSTLGTDSERERATAEPVAASTSASDLLAGGGGAAAPRHTGGTGWGAGTDTSSPAGGWGTTDASRPASESGSWGGSAQQTTTPAAPSTPSVPAGWYADPAGRYELRYWDGGAWTEHVSRAGQQYTDPPVA
jgi:hypothetical protein